MPTVSVIVPTYNYRAFIGDCLESIFSQTYRDFEVIVVDDGSTDGTREFLDQYSGRIKLISQENQGIAKSRNRAIRESSGEYIALIDSDDLWKPEKLQRQVQILEKSAEIGLVYSYAHQIDEQGKRLPAEEDIGSPIRDGDPVFYQLLLNNPIPALTAVFRRECVEDVGYFDERLHGSDDHDLWIRIAAKWKIDFVPEPLAYHRLHPTNTTHQLIKSGAIYRERLYAIEKAFSTYPDEIPQSIKDKALARVSVRKALYQAARGNIRDSAIEVIDALNLDDGLRTEATFGWIARRCGKLYNTTYRAAGAGREIDFYRDFLGLIADKSRNLKELSRKVLSEETQREVFRRSEAGDYEDMLYHLWLASRYDPRLFLSLKMYKIAARAFGSRMLKVLGLQTRGGTHAPG